MKVTKSDIVISAVKPEQYPSGDCLRSHLLDGQMLESPRSLTH